MYITALNGSHNDNGSTAYLLNKILEICSEKGIETEMINVYKAVSDAKIPFCINCTTPCQKACYKGTLLEEAFDKVTKSDFVLIGSPVYFGSMSAQLKAFFDKTRAIRGDKLWLGKPMAAVSVGASKYGGQERTIDAIHSTALVSGMTILGNSAGSVMGHFGVSAQRPAQEDEYANKAAEAMAERICEFLNV